MPTKSVQMPVDSRATVEFAPGFFVPENRYVELMEALDCNPMVAEAVAEIVLERTSADGLTDDLSIEVPFWFIAIVERRLAERLLENARRNDEHAHQVQHSVAGFALSFGSAKVQ